MISGQVNNSGVIYIWSLHTKVIIKTLDPEFYSRHTLDELKMKDGLLCVLSSRYRWINNELYHSQAFGFWSVTDWSEKCDLILEEYEGAYVCNHFDYSASLDLVVLVSGECCLAWIYRLSTGDYLIEHPIPDGLEDNVYLSLLHDESSHNRHKSYFLMWKYKEHLEVRKLALEDHTVLASEQFEVPHTFSDIYVRHNVIYILCTEERDSEKGVSEAGGNRDTHFITTLTLNFDTNTSTNTECISSKKNFACKGREDVSDSYRLAACGRKYVVITSYSDLKVDPSEMPSYNINDIFLIGEDGDKSLTQHKCQRLVATFKHQRRSRE